MDSLTEQNSASTRRDFLRHVGGAVVAGAVVAGGARASADPVEARSSSAVGRIALSDRGAGYRQQLGVFGVARDAGVAGVEVDFGRLGTRGGMDNRLLQADGRRAFVQAANDSGVTISSLALTAFVSQPFAEHPKADEYADDLLFVMRVTGVPLGVLPVSIPNDYVRDRAVARLRRLAPVAERDGLVIALDTDLPATNYSATDVRYLLDAVGSPAIKAILHAGPGASGRLAVLGPDRIGQVRYRYDDSADSLAATAALVRTLSAASWAGWCVVDRPAVATADDAAAMAQSVRQLRSLFASPALTPAFS